MKLSLEHGRCKLTLETTEETPDLTRFDVEQRIAHVMRREVERFDQIITVGLQDLATSAKERERLRSLDPSTRGPTQIVAAGTKAPVGRIVLDDTAGRGYAPPDVLSQLEAVATTLRNIVNSDPETAPRPQGG